jgi:hypothetical protein
MTSKAGSEKRNELAGKADGRYWAENTAVYDELCRVAAIKLQAGIDWYDGLSDAVDPDNELSNEELKRYLFGDECAELTDEYVAGFIEGAKQFSRKGPASSNSWDLHRQRLRPPFRFLQGLGSTFGRPKDARSTGGGVGFDFRAGSFFAAAWRGLLIICLL